MTALPISFRMGAHHSIVVLDEAPASVDAFYEFFESLPPAPDAAFVVVAPSEQNRSGITAEGLAERASLPVTTVTAPTPVAANRIYLSPGGTALALRRNALLPTENAGRTERPGVPIVHVLRGLDKWRQQPGRGNGWKSVSLRLSSPSFSSSGSGGEEVPLLMMEDEETGPPSSRAGEVGPWGESRTERLERELRETRRELRDMVQRYEQTQRRLLGANEALQEKNDLLRERNEQVEALTEAVTRAEEKERERLSHVLHDDLQQVLYAVRTKLDLTLDRDVLDDRGHTLLSRALELLDDGIETTRTLASDLNPPVEKSLWDTLEWLTVQIQEQHGLSVEMRARGRDRTTDKSLRILVVRLVRELLFNVVKHAGTDEAVLTLNEAGDYLYVVVEDDGNGFRPDELEADEEGFGLASVRRRVELVDGRFEVESAPGEGTRVELGVPFQLDAT